MPRAIGRTPAATEAGTIRPGPAPATLVRPDGTIDGQALERTNVSVHDRLSELERRENDRRTLSGSVASSIDETDADLTALSGTVDAQFVYDGLDPSRGFRIFDDYIGSELSRYNGGSAVFVRDEVGHPGIINLAPAASGSSAYTFFKDTTSTFGSVVFGGGPQEFRALVRIPSLSFLEQSCLRVGFHDISVAPPANGVYFEYDFARYGNNSIRFCTAATGSRVQQDTGFTPTANVWFTVRIQVAPDGDAVTGSINGGSAVALRTYVPTAAGSVWQPSTIAVKTAGSSALAHHVDYTLYRGLITGSR